MIYFYIYLAGCIVDMIYLKIENYYFARNKFDHLDVINASIISLFSWLLILFLIYAFSYRGIRVIELYEILSEKTYNFCNMIYKSDFFQRIDFWFQKTKFNKNEPFENVFKE